MNNDNQFTPAGTPAPAPTPTPATAQTDPIAFTPDPIVTPPKKSKKLPIIIASIIGAIVIAGGVFAALWYINFTKPETVALGAMTNLFNQKAVKATGLITVAFHEDNAFGINGLKIRLDEVSSAVLPSATTGAIIVGVNDYEVAVDISSITMTDGTIYFQISGLQKALENSLPKEFASVLEIFETELKGFDGQWYELDLAAIATTFGADISTKDLDCAVAALNSLNADATRVALVDTYKANPFLTLEKTNTEKNSGLGYSVDISPTKLTAFGTYLKDETTALDAFDKCASGATTYDIDAIAAPIAADLALPDVTLYITQWGHELTAIDVAYEDDNITIASSLDLSFPASLDISAPASSTPFSKFLTTIMTKLSTLTDPDTTPATEE